MRGFYIQKYVGVFIGIVISGIIFVLISMDSIYDTEKVKTDRGLYNIGVILDGYKLDGGWNQAHCDGLEDAARNLNVNIFYKENVPYDQMDVYGEDLINNMGCKIIVTTSISFSEGLYKLAERHPEVYFFHSAGNKVTDNISTYFGRMYQARYLSGIVAGMTTKTNHIGYVAAMPIPEVIRGINAFTIGVRKINPEAVVHVAWTGEWNDSNIDCEVTEKLLTGNPAIDMLTYHQDSDALADVADAHNVRVIGYHYDRMIAHKNMITAAVWDWRGLYNRVIMDTIEGRFRSRAYLMGMEDGAIKLLPVINSALTKEQQDSWRFEQNRMEKADWDVFYGPVYDQMGKMMVAPGENLSDDYLFNKMNWFVQGVDGKINGDGHE